MSDRRVRIAIVAMLAAGTLVGQDSRKEGVTESQPTTQGRDLRVVRAPDGLPAAGAVIEFVGFDYLNPSSRRAGDLATGKPIELIANELGVVPLPHFGESARVKGQSGELTGEMWIRTADPTPTVLMLDPPIAVIVVDSTGRPQPEVPVALVGHHPIGLTVYRRGITGPDGIARVPALTRPLGGLSSVDRDWTLNAALAIPLGEIVEVPFHPYQAQSEPLKLALPPTNRVIIRLVTSDEKPFSSAATVELRLKDLPREKWGESLPVLTAPADGGTASFPFVGLTPSLLVSVRPEDSALHTVTCTIGSPRSAGQETTATVVCGARAIIVTGRLVDAESRPLANIHFGAWLPQPPAISCVDGDQHGWFRRTDAEGRFQLRFDVDAAALIATELLMSVGGPWLGTDIRPFDLHREDLAVRLPPHLSDGSADLGDIVVPGRAALPLVATGRVVSDHGVPVPHAGIRLMRRWRSGWDTAWGLWSLGQPAGTDARFELRGRAEDKKLGLIATGDFWICVDPTPFEVGARDVDVIVSRAGGLEGSITGMDKPLSSPFGGSPVRVLIAGPGAPAASRNQVRPGHSDRLELEIVENKFATRELLPGTYSAQFCAPRAGKPLLVVDGIVVRAGELTRDSRLQDVDVRRFMQTRTVTVVDDRGKNLTNATIGARDTNDSSRGFTKFSTYPNGSAIVLTADPVVDLVVAAEGYLAVAVPKVTGDTTVTLQRAPMRIVTIRLDDSVVLPPPPFSISAELRWLCLPEGDRPDRPDLSDPRSASAERVNFGCARSGLARVQNPGVYEVQLWIDREVIWGGRGGGLSQKERPATVTVDETGEASVTVTVDTNDLKKSIERATSR